MAIRWFWRFSIVLYETGSLHQAVVRPRVEPGEPAAQQFHAQIAAFQVAFVDGGDLQFTPGARLDVRSDADDIAVVEVQARHRPVRARARRFFLDGGCPAGLVEGNYAIALGIANLVAEDRSSVLLRCGPVQLLGQAVPIKDVVAKRQGARIVPDKFPADQECLGQPVGAWLLGVAQRETPAAAIAEESLEVGARSRRGDHQDVRIPASIRTLSGVVDHGLIVDGQELLAYRARHGIEPCAFSSGEDDALYFIGPPSGRVPQSVFVHETARMVGKY